MVLNRINNGKNCKKSGKNVKNLQKNIIRNNKLEKKKTEE